MKAVDDENFEFIVDPTYNEQIESLFKKCLKNDEMIEQKKISIPGLPDIFLSLFGQSNEDWFIYETDDQMMYLQRRQQPMLFEVVRSLIANKKSQSTNYMLVPVPNFAVDRAIVERLFFSRTRLYSQLINV